jgi:hypothetical protein
MVVVAVAGEEEALCEVEPQPAANAASAASAIRVRTTSTVPRYAGPDTQGRIR